MSHGQNAYYTLVNVSMKHLKTILLLLFALLLSFVALVLWAMYAPKNTDDSSAELCAQVITDARNPVTGEIQEFSTPCDVPTGWDVLETDRETFTRDDAEWGRFRSDDLGIRFEYRTSPSGYILVEQPTGASVLTLSLFNNDDYFQFMISSVMQEAPPSISVRIFDNPDQLSPRDWVQKNPSDSNSSLALNMRDVTMAGTPGVRYDVDGLYPSDVVVLSNNGRIYVLSGEYLSQDAPIRADFREILDHLSLY